MEYTVQGDPGKQGPGHYLLRLSRNEIQTGGVEHTYCPLGHFSSPHDYSRPSCPRHIPTGSPNPRATILPGYQQPVTLRDPPYRTDPLYGPPQVTSLGPTPHPGAGDKNDRRHQDVTTTSSRLPHLPYRTGPQGKSKPPHKKDKVGAYGHWNHL